MQLPGRCCGQHASCSLARRPRPSPLSAFPFPTERSCRDPLAVLLEAAASEDRPPQPPKSRLQGISFNLIFPIETTILISFDIYKELHLVYNSKLPAYKSGMLTTGFSLNILIKKQMVLAKNS